MVESFAIRNEKKQVMKALSIHKQIDMPKIYINEQIITVWLHFVDICFDMKFFDEVFFFLNKVNSLPINSAIIPILKNINFSKDFF